MAKEAELLTIRTAAWATGLAFDDLPLAVIAMAKRCVLDQIALHLA